MDEFQNGVNVMSKLIGKPINLSISYNCESDFSILNNVELYKIKGAHPSGNESFQINRIDPLNSGEIIWVIKPEDLANIGSFFITGIFNPSGAWVSMGPNDPSIGPMGRTASRKLSPKRGWRVGRA